jgi:hypothetical protein
MLAYSVLSGAHFPAQPKSRGAGWSQRYMKVVELGSLQFFAND